MPYETRTTAVAPDARLLVYSDGVFEIEKRDGAMWQYPEFVAHITAELGRDGVIDRHLAFARELGGREVLDDDFSMLEARFAATPP